MKSLHEIKQALSKVDRFKSINIGFKGFLLGFGLILTGGFLFNGELSTYQPIVILSGFIVFFLSFGYVFVGFFTVTKKHNMFLEIVYNEIWKPLLDEITYDQKGNYTLDTHVLDTTRMITHAIIPQYATQRIHYAIGKENGYSLVALEYTHSTSSGERTSTYTDFIGYVIQTDIDVDPRLLVRRHAPIANFFKSGLKTFELDKEMGGYDITGEFTEDLKQLKDEILSLGFKEVIMIPEENRLCILIPEFHIHGNLKIRDSIIEDAKIHLKRCIEVLELIH